MKESAYQAYLRSQNFNDESIAQIDLVKHYLLIGQFNHGLSHSTAWMLHRKNREIAWKTLQKQSRDPNLVSIVIPGYNEIELTEQCLKPIALNTFGVRYEIILVDNGSTEEIKQALVALIERYNNAHLLRFEKNWNFALGCNFGFAKAKGQTVVFLNNDTQVQPNWLKPLVETLHHNPVFAAQSLLLYPDQTIQCMGVVFSEQSTLGYPIYQGLTQRAAKAEAPRIFQAITGACFAIQTESFAEHEGFDPIYINGQEDIDLCLRVGQATNQKRTMYQRVS